MYTFIGLVVGGMFFQFGNDASMTIFNYGFIFITIIVFMYTPLMPVLLQCKLFPSKYLLPTVSLEFCNFTYVPMLILVPKEVQLLKREYFNRWYGLNAYFCALTCSQLPMQVRIWFYWTTASIWRSALIFWKHTSSFSSPLFHTNGFSYSYICHLPMHNNLFLYSINFHVPILTTFSLAYLLWLNSFLSNSLSFFLLTYPNCIILFSLVFPIKDIISKLPLLYIHSEFYLTLLDHFDIFFLCYLIIQDLATYIIASLIIFL